MVKLAVSQLLNSFAIPVLATYASGNKANWHVHVPISHMMVNIVSPLPSQTVRSPMPILWCFWFRYSRGGLSEAALLTQVGMALVPPLMHLLAPLNLLKRLLFAPFARTQVQQPMHAHLLHWVLS